MLFHFIVVILWLHTKHDNKLIAMQATLSYACGISDIPLKERQSVRICDK